VAELGASRVSLWDAVPVGIDELGQLVSIELVERNLLLGGEPGAGKSAALSLLVASAALDPSVKLWLLDASGWSSRRGRRARSGSPARASRTPMSCCGRCSGGVDVRLWAGRAEDQAAARAAGLEAHRGGLMVDAVTREAELEEITDALLFTPYDDFNALAAAELRTELGHRRVYRVAPDPDQGDLAVPPGEHGVVADPSLTFAELERRLTDGARLVRMDSSELDGAGTMPLFAIGPGGVLRVATPADTGRTAPVDTVVALANA